MRIGPDFPEPVRFILGWPAKNRFPEMELPPVYALICP
jgi:hypothetical protein